MNEISVPFKIGQVEKLGLGTWVQCRDALVVLCQYDLLHWDILREFFLANGYPPRAAALLVLYYQNDPVWEVFNRGKRGL